MIGKKIFQRTEVLVVLGGVGVAVAVGHFRGACRVGDHLVTCLTPRIPTDEKTKDISAFSR